MRPPRVSVLVAAMLVLSGCLGLGGSDLPPSDQRAVAALENAQEAVHRIDSYRATIDGHVSARSADESAALDFTVEEAANVTTREVNATVEVSARGGSPFDSGTRMTYISGYRAYSECARMGWGRHNLSSDRSWVSYTSVGQQLALLNRTNVYWEGAGTVDGAEASVIVAHPTKAQLQGGPTVQNSRVTDFEGATVDNAPVRVWLSNRTDRPLKARREIEISRDGATATATATIRFRAYNGPMPISRPSIGDTLWEFGCPGS